MNDSAPRTIDGYKLHNVGDSAYAALIDAKQTVCSEMHPGSMWLAFGDNQTTRIIFMDDLGSTYSEFTATQKIVSPILGIFIDGELAYQIPYRRTVMRGDTVSVDWGRMYGVMK